MVKTICQSGREFELSNNSFQMQKKVLMVIIANLSSMQICPQ